MRIRVNPQTDGGYRLTVDVTPQDLTLPYTDAEKEILAGTVSTPVDMIRRLGVIAGANDRHRYHEQMKAKSPIWTPS